MLSLYYQAEVIPHTIWLVTSILRNEDGWAFDRALENNSTVLEFFVSPSYEAEFCSFMDYCLEKKLLLSFQKLPNRFQVSG